MSIKKIFVLFVGTLFIFSLNMSCSSKNEKAPQKLNEKNLQKLNEIVIKDIQKYDKSKQQRRYGKTEEERQIAVADACDGEYASCIEKCKKSDCEDVCLKNLTTCEKDLPMELRTLK